jgi:hypothetical protein
MAAGGPNIGAEAVSGQRDIRLLLADVDGTLVTQEKVFRIGHRGTGAAAVSAIIYWPPHEGVANGACSGLFPNRKDR